MKQSRLFLGLLTLVLISVECRVQPIQAQPATPVGDCISDAPEAGAIFSPDGKYVLAPWKSLGGPAKLWSTNTGETVYTLVSTQPTVLVAFSSDGKFILTGSFNGTIGLWNTQTGEKIKEFTPEYDTKILSGYEVINLMLTPDDKYILSADYFGARLWNVQTGKQERFFPGKVDNVVFSRNGKYILMETISAELWDVQTGRQLHVFENATRAGFSSNSDFVLTWEQGMNLWDIRTFNKVASFALTSAVWEFSSDDHYLLTYPDDTSITISDVKTGKILHVWSYKHYHKESYAAFLPDSKHVLVMDDTMFAGTNPARIVLVWDIEQDKEVHHIMIRQPSEFLVSPDGKTLLFLDPNGIYLWDISADKELHKFC